MDWLMEVYAPPMGHEPWRALYEEQIKDFIITPVSWSSTTENQSPDVLKGK